MAKRDKKPAKKLTLKKKPLRDLSTGKASGSPKGGMRAVGTPYVPDR
ncbi:MAG TPA: hypothetical protein VNL37_00945 [Candidatus Polarisedimenticolia bacterium]|nr:hypothetical protein [Candidatus Polarisedimenticolia bacterium]